MADARQRSVAVIGDGPAGTTLAAFLARGGARVGLFAAGRPSAPIVGESLLPAVIPILRELGIEEEVRSYGEFKPGATFVLHDGAVIGFDFARNAGRLPGYAFNVPRDRFDATLLTACRASGARVFERRARLERDPTGAGRVRIAAADAELRDYFGGDPEWIVDATGRRRTIVRLLDLASKSGARRDVALFAHCEGVRVDNAGHVHMDHLRRGWCWRIPLPGVVSLGIVVAPDALEGLGDTAEEQFDACILREPHLQQVAAGARRVSAVARYSNYQWVAERGFGAGWALVGDALGFVDPIFSSGLFLAMEGAQVLARALLAGDPAALRRYERRQRRHLAAWQRMASYYYDGRLFELVRMSRPENHGLFGRLTTQHVTRSVARILTGESTTGAYSPRLLAFLIRHGLRPADPGALRIH